MPVIGMNGTMKLVTVDEIWIEWRIKKVGRCLILPKRSVLFN